MAFLTGKKTYLGCAALCLLGIAWTIGQMTGHPFIDDKTYEGLVTIIGAATGASLRMSVEKNKDAATGTP